MKLRYIVINEQGHTFTVVAVQKSFLQDRIKADQAIQWLQSRFDMPTALMAYDEQGAPTAYYGRRDLALLLVQRPLRGVPWQELAIH